MSSPQDARIPTVLPQLALAIVQPVIDFGTTPLGGRNLVTDAVSMLADMDSFCNYLSLRRLTISGTANCPLLFRGPV